LDKKDKKVEIVGKYETKEIEQSQGVKEVIRRGKKLKMEKKFCKGLSKAIG